VLDCLSPEVKQNEIGHLEKQPLLPFALASGVSRLNPHNSQWHSARLLSAVRCTRTATPFRHFPSNGQPVYNRLNAHYHYSADR